MKTFILFILFIFTSLTICHAEPVTLAWDRNSEPSVIGYKLHRWKKVFIWFWKKEEVVDTGNETMWTLDLKSGDTYAFAVTAYTKEDESDYSEKIIYTVPEPEPEPEPNPSCDAKLCHGD